MFYFLNPEENPGSAFGFLPNEEEKLLSGFGLLLSDEENRGSAFGFLPNEEEKPLSSLGESLFK